ncbi:unnamed protein product [Didymodactylos carnosus]|uniref:Uncharacterized protein n=1 Tax=Didymodactylos carnosus TaxID=1234261 RepID=A0A815MWX4_9BILA|nr:unnamed protein product [Didymodactylos carnosus]CAF1430829.1 unnamed protein product [Didymodactylos carnosus]CAF4085613.1 unnamed protein product [Didymodactylos carnosus]CAF4309613.1 unnamed protein product [Didymodactylos carnosus]
MNDRRIPDKHLLKQTLDNYRLSIEQIKLNIKTIEKSQKNLTEHLQDTLIEWLEYFSNNTSDHLKPTELCMVLSKVFELYCNSFICTLWNYSSLLHKTRFGFPSIITDIEEKFKIKQLRIDSIYSDEIKGQGDILLQDNNTFKTYCVVPCRKNNENVDNEILLKLVGNMVYENCRHGLLMSCQKHDFFNQTKDLIRYLKDKRQYSIEYIFYPEFKELIRNFTTEICLFMLNDFSELLNKCQIKKQLQNAIDGCEVMDKKLKIDTDELNIFMKNYLQSVKN